MSEQTRAHSGEDTSAESTVALWRGRHEEGYRRYFEFLSIPSVSTERAYKKHCDEAALWLKADLQSMGFVSEVLETPGHPMVLAHAGPEGAPHVLFYGHYDVQPVDPLDLWEGDPFTPVFVDTPTGRAVRARGASDDKGQVMTFLEALRCFRDQTGGLPCRVTVLLEGEEETGSPSLPGFLKAYQERLKADIALVCDTDRPSLSQGAITTSLRGLVLEEVILKAAERDLHSGFYGGVACNPIRVLALVLADLHDGEGRVTLEGFYDGLAEVSASQKAQWEALNLTPEQFLAPIGLELNAGEMGKTIPEMLWARPVCDVNGITGGYGGEGSKTIIPAQASAKVSFRLVSGQDPEQVAAAFRQHVRARVPADCSVAFKSRNASPAVAFDTKGRAFEQARRALATTFPDQPPAVIGCGGSIPVVSAFKNMLGMDSLLMGFALADDKIHAPNEKYNTASYEAGCEVWIRFLAGYAAAGRD